MKIAILVGHNFKAQGATFTDNKTLTEYLYNGQVAYNIRADLIPNHTIEVFTRSEGVKKAGKVMKEWGADLCIELHCNSFEGNATGCEALTFCNDTTPETSIYANKFCSMLCKEFGRKNRGVKILSKGDRGYRNLKAYHEAGIPHKFIAEPFFCSTKKDILPIEEYCDFLERYLKGLE
jgi:N-acetylmuramoyl-L-alanine amidase